jgi:hypothetical protein
MPRKAKRRRKKQGRRSQRPSSPPRKIAGRRNVGAMRGNAVTRRKGASRVRSSPASRKAIAQKKLMKRLRRKTAPDPRLEIAVKDMNRGSSLTAAARSVNLPPKSLQSFVSQRRLAKRKGGKWTIKDNRLRRVPVITKGRIRIVTVRGFDEARRAGEHHNAVGDFVRTNNLDLIKPFKGRSVQAVKGKPHPLETDPNALHRIAAMDTPPFHEIYEITSNT